MIQEVERSRTRVRAAHLEGLFKLLVMGQILHTQSSDDDHIQTTTETVTRTHSRTYARELQKDFKMSSESVHKLKFPSSFRACTELKKSCQRHLDLATTASSPSRGCTLALTPPSSSCPRFDASLLFPNHS